MNGFQTLRTSREIFNPARARTEMKKSPSLLVLAALCALCVAGCTTTNMGPEDAPIPESVQKARALFEEDRLTEAIIACTDIYRKDPLTPGLGDLQTEINTRLAELRRRNTDKRLVPSDALAMEDADRQGILPDTYRQRKHVVGESKPIHTLPPETRKLLDKPYTIHLDDVSLSEIIGQIGSSTNKTAINIVSDSALDGGQTMSIHVDNVPLSEILEYVGRNMGVTFAVGRNLIWVTEGNDQAGGPPLFTRIYRLRKGVSKEEIDGGQEAIGIIEAVKRFVPEVEGADILFNKRAHAILAKNTRENLSLIEDIIEVLDVRPPQVLIEARFLTTSVNDLFELGLDWYLDSSWSTSKKGKSRFRTRVVGASDGSLDNNGLSAASITQTAFDNATSGLNFTYQGLLTDPQFHAVLHALQTEGNTRTLSIPRVTAVNNTEAKVRIGKDIRYFEEYDVEEIRTGTNSNGNETYESRLVPSGTPEKEEIGIELVVTPSVGADLSTINLKLVPEISDIIDWEYWDTSVSSSSSSSSTNGTAMGMIKLPIFSRSTVDTEVVVRSGETVVMGSLVTSQKGKAQRGIPIISKIPLIGRLFRHDVTTDETSNLLIFVTATLISDTGEELIPVGPPEPVTAGGKVELGTK